MEYEDAWQECIQKLRLTVVALQRVEENCAVMEDCYGELARRLQATAENLREARAALELEELAGSPDLN